jgi:hypothetical protein
MSTTELLVVPACFLWASGFVTSAGVQLAFCPKSIPKRYHVLGLGLLGTALWSWNFANDLWRLEQRNTARRLSL